MAKLKVIDAEHDIVMIEDKEEDYYFDVPSMRRINYLKRKRAIRLDSENRALIEDIDEAIATARTQNAGWNHDRDELGVLVTCASRPGKRWQNLLQRIIHEKASRLESKILRQDKIEGKIVQRKIPTVVIGREYEAPLPDSHDLEKEFIEGFEMKGEKKEGEQNEK